MRSRTVALLGGAVLVVGVCAASTVPTPFDWNVVPSTPVPALTGPVRLVAYDSCDTALDGLRKAVMPHVTAWGLGGPYLATTEDAGVAKSAPTAGERAPDHSTTNVHEAGVDEPDLVKTDGTRVVSVVDGAVRVVDVKTRAVTATVPLAGPASQVLLQGTRALVIGAGQGIESGDGTYTVAGATVTLVELSGSPRVVGSLTLDGQFVDARQVGDVVRVVVHSGPALPWAHPVDGESEGQALARNREIAATAPISSWLPRYELTSSSGQRSQGTLVDCARLNHPEAPTATSLSTVLTFDFPGELGKGDAVSILADGNTVYGNGTSLYVADDRNLSPTTRFAPTAGGPTLIHEFDVSGSGTPRHVASGEVPGVLLNQYSLSEYQGHLRVATTSADAPGVPENAPSTQSAVTVLKRECNRLVQVGRLDGLGVGERIYSVRFAGPVGYVVTFRQTDPLYTVDLSDPARPRKVGELKITGYSAYLHPVDGGRLLGVGQEATGQGRRLGTQVSLFDVANPAAPTRVAAEHLPGAYSEAEFDPHAFLFHDGVLVLPVANQVTDRAPSSGVLVLRVSGSGFTTLGTVTQPSEDYDGGVRRSMLIGGDLWTVSARGAQVTGLDGLARLAWIPFG
ncbi:beta-propeller domain-containing protein [Actinosynnema sp. NPDC020468]|uniref:beta-propeller domain-containing protein n=1 Tax=Actinosynnema sp. NPDC020468 TaxID=3154488 RepID=UPI0033C3E81F